MQANQKGTLSFFVALFILILITSIATYYRSFVTQDFEIDTSSENLEEYIESTDI